EELTLPVEQWPSRDGLLAALRQSPLVSTLGTEPMSVDAPTPLVLDARGRLYLQRYARYERTLAELLHGRARRSSDVDLPLLRMGIERLFGTPAQTHAGADAAHRATGGGRARAARAAAARGP